jgi:hypothetical protein
VAMEPASGGQPAHLRWGNPGVESVPGNAGPALMLVKNVVTRGALRRQSYSRTPLRALLRRHCAPERQQPILHVLDEWLMAPGP